MYEMNQIGCGSGRSYRYEGWIDKAKMQRMGGTRKGFEGNAVCPRVEGNNWDASKSNG